jgi:hypothetical protein
MAFTDAIKTNTHESDLLLAVFNKIYPTAFGGTWTADTVGSLRLSLHTADPGPTGTQLTSECAYGSYARLLVAPLAANFPVTSGVAENLNALSFPNCSSGTETATHLAVGKDTTGAGKVWYRAELQASLAISAGVTPTIDIDGLKILEE